MNNGLIVLLDGNEKYAQCLCEYLNTHTGLGYKITTFTKLDEFLNFSDSIQIDILLVDDYLFNKLPLYKISFINLFILSGKKESGVIQKDDFTFHVFFKYQSIQSLIHQIMSNFSMNSSLYNIKALKDSASIIGVYSPIKRCGKTSFSIALATVYSSMDSTLLISFDENSTEYLNIHNTQKNLSDIMFYLLEGGNSLMGHLDSAVCSVNGLDIVPPAPYSDDIRHLDNDILTNFFSLLKNTGYRYIVVDFADTLSGMSTLFNTCDKVYMPVINDDISRKKLSSFITALKNIDSGVSEDIFTLITPPIFEYSSEATSIYNQIMISPLLQYISSDIVGHKNDR